MNEGCLRSSVSAPFALYYDWGRRTDALRMPTTSPVALTTERARAPGRRPDMKNPAWLSVALCALALVLSPVQGSAQETLPPGSASGPLRDSGMPPPPVEAEPQGADAAADAGDAEEGIEDEETGEDAASGNGDAGDAASAGEPATQRDSRIVILGDSLAEGLAPSLVEALGDLGTFRVEKHSRVNSGLVRDDFYDWPAAVEELVDADDVIGAVMLIGSNDRQPLADVSGRHPPLTDGWRAIYGARIDAILKSLSDAGASIYWVAAPPMESGRLSSDMAAINEMYRDRVKAADGTFVDIWDAFVDEDGRYSAVGPDLSGAPRRLRASDGVHFTKAGNQKLAHFIEREVRRELGGSPSMSDLLATPVPELEGSQEALTGTREAAEPTAPDQPEERVPEGVQSASPQTGGDESERPAAEAPLSEQGDLAAAPAGEAATPPSETPRETEHATQAPVEPAARTPVIGPIMPLTGDAPAGTGSGLAGEARSNGASAAERRLIEGEALPSRPGRADDFSWRSGEMQTGTN